MRIFLALLLAILLGSTTLADGGGHVPAVTQSTTVLGGVFSKAVVTHFFLTAIGTDGTPASAQPVCADLSDSGSGCTSNKTANSILYKSSNWYGSGNSGTAVNGGVVAVDARMYAIPYKVSSITGSTTFKALGIRVGTAGSGSELKVAVYDNSGTGGRPGALLASGTTPVATTGSNSDVSVTLNSTVTLTNGTYWLVQIHHATTTMPICTTWATTNFFNIIAGASSINGAIHDQTVGGGAVFADTTYASAFPNPFGAATEISGKTGNWCSMAIQAN